MSKCNKPVTPIIKLESVVKVLVYTGKNKLDQKFKEVLDLAYIKEHFHAQTVIGFVNDDEVEKHLINHEHRPTILAIKLSKKMDRWKSAELARQYNITTVVMSRHPMFIEDCRKIKAVYWQISPKKPLLSSLPEIRKAAAMITGILRGQMDGLKLAIIASK